MNKMTYRLLFKSCIRKVSFIFLTISILCFNLVSAQIKVTGRVTSYEDESPVLGAAIFNAKNSNGTITDLNGFFTIEVDQLTDTLEISCVGFENVLLPIGGRTNLAVELKTDVTLLKNLVVTGYKYQRPEDITGAVSIVDVEEMQSYQAPSFSQKLEGRVAGLHTFSSGEPGSPVDIRIRGISSFVNNDPLIIIDGVPVKNRQLNWINSEDIENIQVLKDASTASIYGSRANNGVIIIETKQGKPGKTTITYHGYVGIQKPVSNYDKFLIQDPLEYGQYEWDRYQNAGLIPPSNIFGDGTEPVVPDYIIGNQGYMASEIDENDYAYPEHPIIRVNKEGTNWSKELTRNALITEHNLRVAGGGEKGIYNFSFGYFNQEGTLRYNWLDRFSFRVNSQAKAGIFTFGENLTLVRTEHVLQQVDIYWADPILPIYDIGGNFAENNAFSNPYADLYRNKDNKKSSEYLLGNIFAEVRISDFLKLRTNLGIQYEQNTDVRYTYPIQTTSNPFDQLNEDWGKGQSFTWSNTIQFDKTFHRHSIGILAGYESIHSENRQIHGDLSGYQTTDINAWYLNTTIGDPTTRHVSSQGDIARLASIFGKIDYQFDNRYIFSFTLRHDGSSKFGNNKYGTFPAMSLGWRISQESFMAGLNWLNELKLRAGYGVTGGQDIPSGNAYDQFGGGGPAEAFYDLYGRNNAVETGFALSSYGNQDTRWERNESLNIGFDLSTFYKGFNIIFDWYVRDVDGLLFNPALPGTAGLADPAYVNIAEMQNKGIDLSISYKNSSIRKFGVSTELNIGHYKNEIQKIDGVTDFFYGLPVTLIGVNNINQVGYPISGFYGFIADGLFQNDEEVAAHAEQNGKPGRLRFLDQDEDGIINDEDKSYIGHPHPDLTLGLNLGLNYKGFDFTMFLYSWLGNEIFHYNKYYYELGGFYNSNKNRAVLTDSWTPDNPGATIPRLDFSDDYSHRASSYYIEDGSYLRFKIIQVGYNLPDGIIKKMKLNRLRIYVQAQNLFTITNYGGIDPALSLSQTDFEGRDLLDIYTGYDFGTYPVSKSLTLGLNIEF